MKIFSQISTKTEIEKIEKVFTLTLSQPGGADSAHYRRGQT